jgi:DNA (cytosine-5)-methyltransferase 1
VAQRRRRVFVVGCLGDGNAAAKVLFERESVRRDSPPSREKREGVAGDAQKCFAGNRESGLAAALETTCHDYSRADGFNTIVEPIVIDRAAYNQGENAQYQPHIAHSETMDSLIARGPHAVLFQKSELRLTDKITLKDVCPTLKAGTKAGDSEPLALLYENHPHDSRVTGPHEVAPSCVSRFGTGGGNVPLVQAVDVYNQTIDGDVAATLTKAVGGTNTSGAKVMAFKPGQSAKARSLGAQADIACTLEGGGGGNNKQAIAFEPGIATREGNASRFVKEMSPTLRKDMGDNQVAVADRMAVRRLTPRECERLQGFPDDYTMIPWRNKPADQCPDGPRYKALGNSMAVPCMAWIGERIAKVSAAL